MIFADISAFWSHINLFINILFARYFANINTRGWSMKEILHFLVDPGNQIFAFIFSADMYF